MRRLIAALALLAVLVGVAAPPAHAGSSTDIALGLASFAVFNQIVGPLFRPHRAEAYYRQREVVHVYPQPTVVYAPPPAVTYAPPPPQPTAVHYPHGRYELHVQGQQYVWVWIPNAPPPPPPPPPPAPGS